MKLIYRNNGRPWNKFHGVYHVDFYTDLTKASIHSNGSFFWYLCNLRHRVGGPAIKINWGSNFDIEWYLRGIRYTEEEYWKKVNEDYL